MENDKKCERTVHMTNAYGKAGKRKCGKKAVVIDPNGRNLCQKCMNKWQKKMDKKTALPVAGEKP